MHSGCPTSLHLHAKCTDLFLVLWWGSFWAFHLRLVVPVTISPRWWSLLFSSPHSGSGSFLTPRTEGLSRCLRAHVFLYCLPCRCHFWHASFPYLLSICPSPPECQLLWKSGLSWPFTTVFWLPRTLPSSELEPSEQSQSLSERMNEHILSEVLSCEAWVCRCVTSYGWEESKLLIFGGALTLAGP